MRRVATRCFLALLFGLAVTLPGYADIVLIDDPVALEQQKAVEACGPTIVFGDGFARSFDLNEDGLDDLVIDYANARCGSDTTYFCSATGCQGAVYFGREDGRFELSGFPPTVEAILWNHAPAILVAYHGSFCGRGDDEWCIEIWLWTANNRIKLHQDY